MTANTEFQRIFSWNKYHENLLKKWAQMCKTYSIMHSLSAGYYSTWDKRLGIPVVIFGAVTSASIFGSDIEVPEMRYINGTMALIVTALAGVSKFLGTSEKMTKHQTASFKYTSIAMSIDTILSFPRNERNTGPQEFISYIKSSMLEVRENTPEVLTRIMNNYLCNYDKSLTNVKSNVNKKCTEVYVGSYNYDSVVGSTVYGDSDGTGSDKSDQAVVGGSPSIHERRSSVIPDKRSKQLLSDFADKVSKRMETAGNKLECQTDNDLSESEEERDIEMIDVEMGKKISWHR